MESIWKWYKKAFAGHSSFNLNFKILFLKAQTKTREEIFECREPITVSVDKFISAVTESILNGNIEENEFLSYAEFEAIVNFTDSIN